MQEKNVQKLSVQICSHFFSGQEVKDETVEEEIEELRNKDTEDNLDQELAHKEWKLELEHTDGKHCRTKLETHEKMAMLLLHRDKQTT